MFTDSIKCKFRRTPNQRYPELVEIPLSSIESGILTKEVIIEYLNENFGPDNRVVEKKLKYLYDDSFRPLPVQIAIDSLDRMTIDVLVPETKKIFFENEGCEKDLDKPQEIKSQPIKTNNHIEKSQDHYSRKANSVSEKLINVELSMRNLTENLNG